MIFDFAEPMWLYLLAVLPILFQQCPLHFQTTLISTKRSIRANRSVTRDAPLRHDSWYNKPRPK